MKNIKRVGKESVSMFNRAINGMNLSPRVFVDEYLLVLRRKLQTKHIYASQSATQGDEE